MTLTETPTPERFLEMPLDQRLAHIQRIYVRHQDIKDAWRVLTFSGKRLRETSTGYIIGHSRCGKSETIKRYIREQTGVDIKRERDPVGDPKTRFVRLIKGKDKRIVYADMTGGMTPRMASYHILTKLFKFLKSEKAVSEGDAGVYLVDFFNQHQIDQFIVDEAQQMFMGQGKNAARKLGRWLLALENSATFRTVIVGGEELRLLHTSVEAAGLRKGGFRTLKPFEYRTPQQRARFRTFVEEFAKDLPFPKTCLLGDDGTIPEDMLFAIYFATRGIPGELAKLCEMATEFWFENSKNAHPTTLTMDDFASAFDFNLMEAEEMHGFNPFRPDGKLPPSIALCNADLKEQEDKENRKQPGRNAGGRLHDDF